MFVLASLTRESLSDESTVIRIMLGCICNCLMLQSVLTETRNDCMTMTGAVGNNY